LFKELLNKLRTAVRTLNENKGPVLLHLIKKGNVGRGREEILKSSPPGAIQGQEVLRAGTR
jgi:hypothetical protein